MIQPRKGFKIHAKEVSDLAITSIKARGFALECTMEDGTKRTIINDGFKIITNK